MTFVFILALTFYVSCFAFRVLRFVFCVSCLRFVFAFSVLRFMFCVSCFGLLCNSHCTKGKYAQREKSCILGVGLKVGLKVWLKVWFFFLYVFLCL